MAKNPIMTGMKRVMVWVTCAVEGSCPAMPPAGVIILVCTNVVSPASTGRISMPMATARAAWPNTDDGVAATLGIHRKWWSCSPSDFWAPKITQYRAIRMGAWTTAGRHPLICDKGLMPCSRYNAIVSWLRRWGSFLYFLRRAAIWGAIFRCSAWIRPEVASWNWKMGESTTLIPTVRRTIAIPNGPIAWASGLPDRPVTSQCSPAEMGTPKIVHTPSRRGARAARSSYPASWNRIPPAFMEGMAPADSLERHPPPAPPAVFLEGLVPVLGARGREAAPADQAKQGTHRHPVDPDQGQGGRGDAPTYLAHSAWSSSRRRAASASTARARATITTSRPAWVRSAMGRTSSRRRRLIRLRTTAFPSLRLTANPTRGWPRPLLPTNKAR